MLSIEPLFAVKATLVQDPLGSLSGLLYLAFASSVRGNNLNDSKQSVFLYDKTYSWFTDENFESF